MYPPRAVRRLGFIRGLSSIGFALALLGGISTASAQHGRIIMKDGRTIAGRYALISSVVNNANNANAAKTIALLDDGLRRVYVPFSRIADTVPQAGEPQESFEVPQQLPPNGNQVAAVGGIVVSEFDEYGRRTISMMTNLGRQSAIQGITEITPEWTKLECVHAQNMNLSWDMRIATNSIPRSILGKILAKAVDPKNLDHRLKIARLYIQSERFKDAEAELTAILSDFPNLPAGQRQTFEQTRVRLRQTNARRMLTEIETRKKAGQNAFAQSLLEAFPTDNVAGETLQAVSGLVREYKQFDDRRVEALARFDEILAKIKDSALRTKLTPVRDEIRAELKLNTIDRMAAFMQFHADDSMTPEDKIALAVSGWLGGSDFAVRNIVTAVSMYETRGLINDYLRATSARARDPALAELLASLRRQEAFTPELVARLLSLLKPPLPIKDEEISKKFPGLCEMQVADIPNQTPIDYYVQLPKEYDPHRRYPTIVVLHAAGLSPGSELDWWCGAVGPDGTRFGQADRHGYIVIAPAWAKEQQLSCNYSEDEHGAVLYALRDAMRKFAIDTDRIFISGHSMGGDAAWDIALAHPDIWAGFIGVTPLADKTITLYQENARYVPMYLIFGEKDGAVWVKNSLNLDHYLTRGYNCTVVEFKGRGHEHFSDELLRLFDWMSYQKREFAPKKFAARSIRLWDGSFWWVETNDPPDRAVWDPEVGMPKGNIHNLTEVEVTAKNGIRVKSPANAVTVWFLPEVIDFKQPSEVTIKGVIMNRANKYIEPDAAVMLEDARTRSDRQHPFWAKLEYAK